MEPFDLDADEWEEPGWEIAAHTTSPPLDWGRVDTVVIHYPADPSIPETPTIDNFIAHLRASQRSYVNGRGYSYGYGCVVWDGMSAEVRGEKFRNAANTPQNATTFAIQVRVEGQTTGDSDTSTPANPQEIEAVRRIIAWAQAQAGRKLAVIGHRDVRATGCPGDAMYAQVQDGTFRPLPTIPDLPPGEDIDMETLLLWRHEKFADMFLLGNGPALHVSPAVRDHYTDLGVQIIVDDHAGMLASVLASASLTHAHLTPL
jgi:hypothetical protein